MQGGKKGRGPKASARAAAPDPNKERFTYMLTSLTGQLVTVKMNNGQMWEGNFHACSCEGDISITLKTARQIPTGRGKSEQPLDTMVIQGKDFSQVSAMNVPPMEPKSSAFKTDAEIAESWGEGHTRELVAWAGGSQAQPAGVSMHLESTRQIGTWNQFERNEQMFGITSTYSEDLYTTKLDPSKIPEQKRKDAERIAREIESGQNFSRIEEGVADDVDEEAQFSAVGHRGSGGDTIHAPLTMENVSQHDAASAELHGDGFAREHRAKRYMITAHSSRMPQLSEMKSINALNLEPALPKFDDKTRSDWINFKQSHNRQGQGPAREELQQSLQAIQSKEGNGKKPTAQSTISSGGNHKEVAPDESKGDASSKFSFNPSAKEFSFNPQAATFTPTGGSTSASASAGAGGTGGSTGGNGGTVARNGGDTKPSSGSKKDTGGEKNSAMAPGPLQNARTPGATKSFSEFLKPAKTGGKKQTLDDLLSRLFKACDNPQNCSPNWESAKGPSYKEILGQPTAGSQAALQLQQQMLQSTQMKQSNQQSSQSTQSNQQASQLSMSQNQNQQQMQQMQQMQQQMQSQQNTQQSQSQQSQQMGMQMMQPQGGFIMAVPGCGNQQMLQQQMFQQMPGGAGRGNNSQGQGMQNQQQPQMQMGQQTGQGQQQMGGCPQNMMGGQFVALQGNMGQGNVGMTGMGAMPKFGAQVVPMMVPAGQFPQGFMPQGMQGGNMQGMPQMGDGMMPQQMQNQMMQQGQMQGCGYRGMGGQGE